MFDIKYELQDPVTATAAAVGVLGGAQYKAQRDASKEQKKARKVEQRLQRAKAARERRAQIRQAQQAQAQIETGAVATGTQQTSAAAGGVGSVQTQLASNLSFLNQSEQAAKQISIFQQAAADDRERAQAYGAATELGLKAMSIFGGATTGASPPQQGTFARVNYNIAKGKGGY